MCAAGVTPKTTTLLTQLLSLGSDNALSGAVLKEGSVPVSKLAGSIPSDRIASLTASKITGSLPAEQLVEADPVFAISAASRVTDSLIAFWSAAYSWGNHALAGYAAAASIPLPASASETGTAGPILTCAIGLAAPESSAWKNVQLFKNGLLMRPTTDYTIQSNGQIDLAVAAIVSDAFQIFFWYYDI